MRDNAIEMTRDINMVKNILVGVDVLKTITYVEMITKQGMRNWPV